MGLRRRLIGIATACAALAVVQHTPPASAETVIKLGNVQPPAMIVQKGLQRFADLVAERTGGELKVEIFPASQLGTEQEILEGVQLGTIHMFEGSAGAAGRFLPALEAFAHPFLWRDLDHMLAVARGEIGQELSQRLIDEHGMRILDMGWLFGQRHLTTASTPVYTPEDMKGLKIRVQPTTIYLEMIKAMGANPTPIDWKEVYLSLQTGVVDGQENPVGVIYSAKLYEVQDYLMLTGHITQNQVVIINEPFFQSLAPEHQRVLREAIIEAGDYQNALIEQGAAEDLEKLTAAGMTVVEPDIEAFRAATANIYKLFENQWGAGLFERMGDAGS
jgi:tripartite ATP-independent transporter DctP family solute receptor